MNKHDNDEYVPKYNIPPTRAQINAAKLIMKRCEEGKSDIVITPKIKYLASYDE